MEPRGLCRLQNDGGWQEDLDHHGHSCEMTGEQSNQEYKQCYQKLGKWRPGDCAEGGMSGAKCSEKQKRPENPPVL